MSGTTSNKSLLFLWAALFLTGAVAVYSTITAFSLSGDVAALRATVNGPGAASATEPGSPTGTGSAAAAAPRDDSLTGRLAATEAKLRAHERTIEDLSSIIAGLAGVSGSDVKGLEIGADGEATGPAAAKLRAFLKNERLAERREYVEKVAARIDSVVSEKHAAFVEEKGLGADKDKALAELEADVNDKARTLAEAVMSGEKMWWEIRPEARVLFDDTLGRLNGVLGEPLANEYLDRFSDDFPMLRRWRSGDSPWGGGGAGAAAGTAAAGSGG